MSSARRILRKFGVVKPNIFIDFECECYLCKFNTFQIWLVSHTINIIIMIGYVVGHVEQFQKELGRIINNKRQVGVFYRSSNFN